MKNLKNMSCSAVHTALFRPNKGSFRGFNTGRRQSVNREEMLENITFVSKNKGYV